MNKSFNIPREKIPHEQISKVNKYLNISREQIFQYLKDKLTWLDVALRTYNTMVS